MRLRDLCLVAFYQKFPNAKALRHDAARVLRNGGSFGSVDRVPAARCGHYEHDVRAWRHGMRVLPIQAGLHTPPKRAVQLVIGAGWRTSLRAEYGKGRRRRNFEDSIEDGKVGLNRGTAESGHNKNRLPGAVQVGWEVVRLLDEARPEADDLEPRTGSAVGQSIGDGGRRTHRDIRRIGDVVEVLRARDTRQSKQQAHQ